jgi:hypothetical protein
LLAALSACAANRSPAVPPAAPIDDAAQRRAAVALATETPVQADAFVDSIGVNTHLVDDLTADREYALIVERMKELGVRHVRDGIFPGQTATQNADERNFFAATGARMEAITDCPRPLGYFPHSETPPSLIRAFDAATGGNIELLEGPNEPDLRGVPGWAPLLVHCIENLNLNHALPVPFVAPAMGDAFHTGILGNISQLVSIGAIHRYFSAHNPGTHGFWRGDACGIWGQIAFFICEARINAGPAAPLYVTETGYTTFGEVDEKTAGKYISRVLFIDSLAGIVRSYIYELHDDGTARNNSENGYGLFRYDGTPKPAFNAVRNEIALLTDPGPSFTPAPLQFAVSGPASIRHELFQKRNGAYVLAVWNEVESWHPNGGGEIAVPPVPVIVTFAATPGSVRWRSLDDAGNLVSHAPAISGAAVTLHVDDRVSFLNVAF